MIVLERRSMVGAVILVVAILATGCAGSSSTSKSSGEEAATSATGTTGAATTTGAPTIEQAREAGAVARAIDAEPNRAAEILAKHGMTAQSLESLIFEIAKDPKLSEAYEEARGASSG